MVASELASLSNFHMPSRLRPRHRQSSPKSVSNYGAQSGTDIEMADRKTTRYFRHESANAAESMNKTLKFARYLLLLLIFVMVSSRSADGVHDEETDVNTIVGGEEVRHVTTRTATTTRRSAANRPIERRATPRPTQNLIQHHVPSIGSTRRQVQLKLAMDTDLNVSRNATKPTLRIEPNPNVMIPQNIDTFLQDVSAPRMQKGEVPFFWHILKSGGTTTKDAIGMCLHLVEASESGK